MDLKTLKERAKELTKLGSIHEVTIDTVGKLLELVQVIASLPDEEQKDEWPKKGDWYWWLCNDGLAVESQFFANESHNKIVLQGIYRTGEEAEKERLRREARAKQKWRPKHEEDYWYVKCYGAKEISSQPWAGDMIDYGCYFSGNCHKTKKDAEAWRDKYWSAFFEM